MTYLQTVARLKFLGFDLREDRSPNGYHAFCITSRLFNRTCYCATLESAIWNANDMIKWELERAHYEERRFNGANSCFRDHALAWSDKIVVENNYGCFETTD